MAILELVRKALPSGIKMESLLALCPGDNWAGREDVALSYALRKHPQLDWDAYIANNADVSVAGLDPVLHFLKYGIYEKRKLPIHGRQEKANYLLAEIARPAISVIIASDTRSLSLATSITSVLNQTLRDLEIIISFHTSEGQHSPAIELPNDYRIRKIGVYENASAARKAAVAAATGKFIAFMTAGDRYLPETCDNICKKLAKGFDLLSFKSRGVAGEKGFDKGAFSPYLSTVEQKHKRLASSIAFGELKNIACEASLCKTIFGAINLHSGDSAAYENAALIVSSQNTSHLDKIFVQYNEEYIPVSELLERLPSICAYLEGAGFNEVSPFLKREILSGAIEKWMKEQDAARITGSFENLAKASGIYDVLEMMIEKYPNGWKQIASQFRHFDRGFEKRKRPETIGILYNRLVNGGAERVIIHLTHLLTAEGYNVRLFLERPYENERELPPEAEIYYVGRTSQNPRDMRNHLEGLGNAVSSNPVDVMLCHACYDGNLLWQLMLLKYMGVPFIGFMHGAFFSKLLHPDNPFSLQDQVATLRCADQMVVLSIYEELYYRINGVNAQYVPNPVRLPKPGEQFPPFTVRRDNIVVFSRLGDPVKNVTDCLLVLKEIIKSKPAVKMTFIGSFAEGWGRQRFEDLAASLGVQDNINITGWVHDATPFIDKACLLVSCAYHEAFPLTVSESQGRGLPCIIYELPVMAARDNPSLMRVRHGDVREMAQKAIEIMDNGEEWYRLSEYAKANANMYSEGKYIAKIKSLLERFQTESGLTEYTESDYEQVIRSLGFYGAHLPPWYNK